MLKNLALLCLLAILAPLATAQTTVTGSFLPLSGQTPQAAGLIVSNTIAGTAVCGELDFVAYNAATGQPTALQWNGSNYLPQKVRGYIRCSDGALINPSGAQGISIIPNTDAAPAGTLTWMQGGLTGSADGTIPPTNWSEAKAVPDQPAVSWGTLPVATIVDVGYQTVESQGSAVNPRPTLNFTGGMTCQDNLASNRTDCQPTILSNPMTTLGDLLFGGPTGAPTRLAGNTSTARQFLVSQGSGGVAAAPFFSALSVTDLPATIGSDTTGNAATATALQNAPRPCDSPQVAVGVDVSGNASCAQLSFGQISGSVASSQLPNPSASALGGTESFLPVAHEFLTGLSTLGVPLAAQPSFADVSGTASDAQLTSAYSGIGSCASHQWVNILTRNATPSCSQPSFADISGVASAAQIPAPTATTLGGVESVVPIVHEFVTGISIAGVPSLSQPSFADLSGTLTASQVPAPTLTTLGGLFSVAPVAHKWVNSVDTSGAPQLSQPSFADISGSVASAQLPVATTSAIGGVETANPVAHQWINSINASGAPQLSQPAFSDVSGVATETQLPATTCFIDQSCAFGAHSYDFTLATLFAIPKVSVDPSSPQAGQEWINGAALKYRDNQATPTTETVEIQANKGVASGYASLDSGAHVPMNQLASGSAGSNTVLFGNQTWAQLNYSQITGTPTLQYQTVQNAGSALTQRSALNFTGTGVSCTDNVTFLRTDCTITAGSGGAVAIQTNAVNNTSQTAVNFQNSGPFTWSNPSGGNEQLALANQSANLILAGPSSGVAATPSFRSLVGADLPNPSTSTLGGVEAVNAVAHEWINAISASGVPQLTQPAFSDLSGTLTAPQLPADVAYLDVAQTVTATKTFAAPVLINSAAAGFRLNVLGDMNVAQLANAAAPTLGTGGTAGSTSYSYECTALDDTGETIGSPQTINTGNATLSSSNFVTISCPSVTGAVSENVYRTAGGGSQGKIGNVSNGGSLNDTGLNATTALPSANFTGQVSIASLVNGKCVNSGAGGLLGNSSGQCGTVMSVALSLPSIFSVSGSPITSSGTLSASLASQSANLVFAGPSSGVAAAPSFRALVGADLPNPTSTTLGGIESLAAVSHQFVNAISTAGVPSTAQPAFTDISGTAAASQLPNPTASTLGGVESFAAVTHQFINSISTSGVPSSAQPAFSDISGTLAASQCPNPSASTIGCVESAAAVSHEWINAISTLGVPSFLQPSYADISGTPLAVANDATIGTIANTLTKINSSGNAIIAGVGDTAVPVFIAVSGAGKTGSVSLASFGIANCAFDGATTAGHFVEESTTAGGDCHDIGATAPSSGWVIGQVMTTNAAAGTYGVTLAEGYNAAAGSGGGLPSGPTSPNGVPEIITSTPTGGVAGAPTWGIAGITPRHVSGTLATDTLAATDDDNTVVYDGSVSVTVTLPTPSTLGVPQFVARLTNTTSGSATPVTVLATSNTFSTTGSGTLSIPQGQSCLITAQSSSAWDAECHDLPLVAGANATITRGQFGPTISFTGGGSSGTAGPNYAQSFTNQTQVTLLGTSHNLATKNLILACYDTASPANAIQPASWTVNPTTFDVIVNFTSAQSGYCALNGSGPAVFSTTEASSTSWSITAATHGLGANLQVMAYDSSGNRIEPANLLVDSSGNVTLSWAVAQAGKVVITQ